MEKQLILSGRRLNSIVPLIFCGTFLLALSLAFFVPIFTDEVGWKIISSRIKLDNGQAISLFPQCHSTFLQTTPFWLQPARYLDAFIYGDLSNLLKLRLMGCICFSLFVGLFILLFDRLSRKEKGDPNIKWIATSLTSVTLFGVLPLKMVLNRPEPAILICLTGLLLLPTLRNEALKRDWLLRLGFCTLTLLLFSQHPKTLFFSPLIILVALFLTRSFQAKIVLVVFTLFVTASAFRWASKAIDCPEDKWVNQVNSNVMVAPKLIQIDAKMAFRKLLTNFLRYKEYIYQILFSDAYQYEWLPEIKMQPMIKKIINSLLKNIILTWMGLIALLSFFVFRNMKRWWKSYPFLAAIVLLSCMVGLNCFQSIRHFYEAPFIIPLLVLCVGVLITLERSYPQRVLSFVKLFSLATLLVSMVSVVILTHYFYPLTQTDWTKGGYLPAQRYSVSAFNRDKMRPRIEKLAAKCEIRNESALEHLVVDDYTYSFFGKTRAPFHAHYIMKFWGRELNDKLKFLSDYQSAGLIASCRFLDEDILRIATRDEELCCIRRFS